jgi:hypothetical protein
MKNSDIKDPDFFHAVEAIDAGNVPALKKLLTDHPELVMKPLDHPEEGYFKNPWLLYFIADNPIRHGKLPGNIPEIASLIISTIKIHSPGTLQDQLNYTLELVSTGRTPRDSGVQIALIDLLVDEGAIPGNGHGAIAHANLEAAKRLFERGGQLTLATAVCLGWEKDIARLLDESSDMDKQTALVAASFYGKPEMIRKLLENGVDVNAYLQRSSGFHWHATALHQAVYSGSLESVKMLVEAGANLQAVDKIYDGTPLGWAKYMQTEETDPVKIKKFAGIELYLAGLPPFGQAR